MIPQRSRLLARLHDVERGYDALARRWTPTDHWRIGIQPYRTMATDRRIDLHCRVLRRTALTEPTAGDPWWRNVWNVYQQFESDEVPGATVLATDGLRTATLITDEEGYASGSLEAIDPPPRPGHNRLEYRVVQTPMGRPHQHASITTAIRPDAAAAIGGWAIGRGVNGQGAVGLISDIDDTVLHSEATSPLRTIYWVALHNSFSRRFINGVVPLYQKLTDFGRRPTFYVSSSPWNLYPMLSQFIRRSGLPIGPLFLRDLGLGGSATTPGDHSHKAVKIRHILETYPAMNFILMGDAGQHDAEIYHQIAREFPGRILAAYIRWIGRMPEQRVVAEVAAARDGGAPMMLLPDSAAITSHAQSIGLIDRAESVVG